MSLLIFALVVLLVTGLILYALDRAPIPSPIDWIIQVIVIIIAALAILQRAGFV